MDNPQFPLICDTYRDAITAAIVALGGNKTVGHMFWPAMDPDEAGRKLAHCLNTKKRETLKPEELQLLRRAARQAGVHVLATFENRDAGYADPQPVEPEDERAALQREFTQSVKELQGLASRIERLGART